MAEMYRYDIMQSIYDLDEDVSLIYPPNMRFQIVIVGGGALILRNMITRATSDIDILNADARLFELMKPYNMNTRVNAYMGNFPYNYENRLELLWSGKNVEVYTVSLEDLIIAKLCSNRPIDMDDAGELADRVDWKKLEFFSKR